MPRFVILDHDWPEPHFDLMLENQATLLTWRLPPPPDRTEDPASPPPTGQTREGSLPFTKLLDPFTNPHGFVSATPLPDHRLVYLDYEGPVSRDRGRVKRIEAGEFVWIERTPDRILVDLRSPTLSGQIELVRSTFEPPEWHLHWIPTPASSPEQRD